VVYDFSKACVQIATPDRKQIRGVLFTTVFGRNSPQGPAHEGRGRGLGGGVRSHRVSDVKARSAGRKPQAAPRHLGVDRGTLASSSMAPRDLLNDRTRLI
ncbi:MAG: hypothetical protein ACR2IY_12575, partial [Rubrivivax sp.]